jgi:hypothetical protein
MKLLLTAIALLAGSIAMGFAQKGEYIVMLDGRILVKRTTANHSDTVRLHFKTDYIEAASAFTISFPDYNNDKWVRSTWLENENITDPLKYTYNLSTSNGIVTIPAKHIRELCRKFILVNTSVAIYTSLKPKNDMMMVRETRELVCKILID